MRTCPHCNGKIPDDQKNVYCPHCGNIADPDVLLRMKIEKELKEGKKEPSAQVKRSPEPEPKRTSSRFDDSDFSERAEEKKSIVPIVIGVVVIIGLIAAAVLFL